MAPSELQRILRLARAGDAEAREALLEHSKPFVARVAGRQARRYLAWENDEELSVALLAFNEAVDAWREDAGAGFLGFAQILIRRRLVDHFHRQSRHRAEGLDDPRLAEDGSLHRLAQLNLARRNEEEGRAADLEELAGALARFGFGLRDLAQAAPRRSDAKRALALAALELASDAELMARAYATGQLPLREMAPRVRVSRKTLERGRRYLIALAVILDRRLDHLEEYLKPLLAGAAEAARGYPRRRVRAAEDSPATGAGRWLRLARDAAGLHGRGPR